MSIYLNPAQCASLALKATLPTEKIQLTEQLRIYPSDDRFDALITLCQLSKNLYNATLFQIRQQFFENKTFLNYATTLCERQSNGFSSIALESCAADDEISRSKFPQFLWLTSLNQD